MSGLIDMWTTEVAKFKDKGMSYFHIEKREPQLQRKGSRASQEIQDDGEKQPGAAVYNQYHPQVQEHFPVYGNVLRIKTSTSNAPLITDEALHMVFDCSSP